MGCTCGYQGIDNKAYGFEEYEKRSLAQQSHIDGSKSNLNEDMMRITSMSRISSQRSILLKNMKKQKEMKEPMKIGKSNTYNI